MDRTEQINVMKDMIHEKTGLSHKEIDELDLDVFMKIADLVVKVWEQAKTIVSNAYETIKECVYETLSEATGLDEDFLKENISFDLACNMLEQYSRQEDVERDRFGNIIR